MGPGETTAPASIPHLPDGDSALALLREGYNFVSRRCERLGSDAFTTTLLRRPLVCTRGADAARMFSQPGRFTRQGAAPPTVTRLLQGKPSVQQMEGLVGEGKDAMEKVEEGPVRDAALIGSAQKVEHYEIAAYGTLCAMAKQLGYKDALRLLKTSLDEEKATDEKLTALAEGGGNQRADKAA